ncbi:MAG: OadG family protein [Pseudomonadales bacterium]
MDVSNSLITEALELMLAGMGTVFVFLVLLVWATQIMSRLVRRYVVEVGIEDDGDDHVSAEEVAAATAAVTRYRQEH